MGKTHLVTEFLKNLWMLGERSTEWTLIIHGLDNIILLQEKLQKAFNIEWLVQEKEKLQKEIAELNREKEMANIDEELMLKKQAIRGEELELKYKHKISTLEMAMSVEENDAKKLAMQLTLENKFLLEKLDFYKTQVATIERHLNNTLNATNTALIESVKSQPTFNITK